MVMKGQFGEHEDIKIEVTMFDGCMSVPRTGDDQVGEDLRLHISVIVDISRKDGSDALEFVCSAWPDTLEIHKIYVLNRDNAVARPYMGPDFRYDHIFIDFLRCSELCLFAASFWWLFEFHRHLVGLYFVCFQEYERRVPEGV